MLLPSMANAMAEECFQIGSRVEIQTVAHESNERITGEVTAYDDHTKALAMRNFTRNGDKKYMTIRIVNTDFVTDLKVKPSDNGKALDPLPMVAPGKAKEKIQFRTQQRNKKMVKMHVSAEGQNLMTFIEKTFPDVKWEADKLIILNSVSIAPPYDADSVCQLSKKKDSVSQQTVDQIKKVVAKFKGGPEMDKRESRSKSVSPDDSTSSSTS